MKASRKDWIKFAVVTVLYLMFLLWLRSWLGLVVLPFIYDAYITRKIPLDLVAQVEESGRGGRDELGRRHRVRPGGGFIS